MRYEYDLSKYELAWLKRAVDRNTGSTSKNKSLGANHTARPILTVGHSPDSEQLVTTNGLVLYRLYGDNLPQWLEFDHSKGMSETLNDDAYPNYRVLLDSYETPFQVNQTAFVKALKQVQAIDFSVRLRITDHNVTHTFGDEGQVYTTVEHETGYTKALELYAHNKAVGDITVYVALYNYQYSSKAQHWFFVANLLDAVDTPLMQEKATPKRSAKRNRHQPAIERATIDIGLDNGSLGKPSMFGLQGKYEAFVMSLVMPT